MAENPKARGPFPFRMLRLIVRENHSPYYSRANRVPLLVDMHACQSHTKTTSFNPTIVRSVDFAFTLLYTPCPYSTPHALKTCPKPQLTVRPHATQLPQQNAYMIMRWTTSGQVAFVLALNTNQYRGASAFFFATKPSSFMSSSLCHQVRRASGTDLGVGGKN